MTTYILIIPGYTRITALKINNFRLLTPITVVIFKYTTLIHHILREIVTNFIQCCALHCAFAGDWTNVQMVTCQYYHLSHRWTK